MTTFSRSDLATRVLKDLGLVGADETPSASDQEWAEETCDSEIALLGALGLPIWNGSEVSIPQEYLTALSRRVGLAVAPSFGLSDIATAQIAMRDAEASLMLLANPLGGTPRTARVTRGMPL